MSMMFYKEEFLCVCNCVSAMAVAWKKTQEMHNSSSVIKMMIAVQWLLLVLVGGTSGSSEQNVKTSGFKTRYIQSCFSLLQNHQRLFVFYHFTFSFKKK